MSAEFPHLHVKTVYSPMRGLVKLEALARREVACVTDTTLWAAARLAKMRKKRQTIYGLEVVPEAAAGHVVLLAEDMEGWRTLCEVGRDGLKMGQRLRGVHLLTGGAEGVLMGNGGGVESVLEVLRGMVPDGYLWVELAPTCCRAACQPQRGSPSVTIGANVGTGGVSGNINATVPLSPPAAFAPPP